MTHESSLKHKLFAIRSTSNSSNSKSFNKYLKRLENNYYHQPKSRGLILIDTPARSRYTFLTLTSAYYLTSSRVTGGLRAYVHLLKFSHAYLKHLKRAQSNSLNPILKARLHTQPLSLFRIAITPLFVRHYFKDISTSVPNWVNLANNRIFTELVYATYEVLNCK